MEINLLKYNRHWEKGYFYPYKKKRFLFSSLLKNINNRFIVELTGLRRVGKSTLLFQLINYLLEEKHINCFKILYFTFDEETLSLDDLFSLYSTQAQIDFKNEKIYVFLDEVQKLPNFQNQIKVYYDLYPNIKFFISGSTSLFIKKKTQESLAGRTLSFNLNPLTFNEYLYFKEKEEMLKKPLVFEKELEKEIKTFLTSQFIESINFKDDLEKKEYFVSIVKKIIFEDMTKVFSFDYPEIAYSIVKLLAQYPGALINLINLSKDLKISNKTLSLYFDYLTQAFLIKKFYNFSKNIVSVEKRLKKYYLSSTSFSYSLIDFQRPELLFENYFASILNTNYFWQDQYKNEVDFVVVKNENIVPYEIKYKKVIGLEDTKNLLLFLEKYKLFKGCVCYLGKDKKTINIKAKKIELLPFYYF